MEKLLSNGENSEYEFKKAENYLPEDIWETYSAFANTNGGIIVLGVKEKRDEFTIFGVNNPKAIEKQFFDCINNKNKVNINLLSNSNVKIIEINGKNIIKITIPRASRLEKPIFINNNPMTGTYKRNHSGDYKCTESEIRRMFAEQSDIARDNIQVEDVTIEDINFETLMSYRKRFSIVRGTTHAWVALSDTEFLYQIGAVGRDKNHLTLAGLLMFGTERVITEILPTYFLDYREVNLENADERWSNRITSSDGGWSGNLYDFYFKIINRLTSDLDVPFKIKNNSRNDDTIIHIAIREALTNTLVHADYNESGSILIEKKNNTFIFSNPGNLRIPKERALKGGESDPRNPTLHKMFSLIGIGERAGSGLITIQTAWKTLHWQHPVFEELVQPDKVILTLKTISLIPNDILDELKIQIGEGFNLLTNNEILALAFACQYENVTNIDLQNYAEISSYESNKVLSNLVSKDLLKPTGSGRGMKYSINYKKKQVSHASMGSSIGGNIGGSIGGNIGGSIGGNIGGKEQKINMITSITLKNKKIAPDTMLEYIVELCAIKPFSAKELAKSLNRDDEWIKKEYISKLVKEGKIKLLYPNQPRHPDQKYYI